MGRPAATQNAVAAGHKYPDHDLTALAAVAQRGEPMLGPG